MPSILELLMQSELVQLDSHTDVFFETAPTDVISEEFSEGAVSGFSGSTAKPPLAFTDSDSGDSLFLTQSVTPAQRTVKRCRSSERPGTIPRGEPDSHLSDDDLFGSPQKVLPLPEKRAGGSCSQPRKRRPAPVRPKRREFPCSGKLSVHKSHTLMNSEVGGFFKCMYNMNIGRGVKRRELSPSFLPSVLDEGSTEEDHENDHDDIRTVGLESFISNCPKRNRQTWLPASRWKSRQSSRTIKSKSNTAPKKDNGRKKEKIEDKKKQKVKKKSPVSAGAKGKRKAQENTETLSDTEVGSLSVRTLRSKSRKQENESRTSFSSPGCSSVRSLLIEQEQHSENQLEVLAACTQSESLDLHCSNTQSCENLALEGANDDGVVEETQRPGSDQASEDSDRTPSLEMLEEELRERDEDGMYETSKENHLEIFVGVETSSHADNTEHCELQRSSQSCVPRLSETTSPIADEIRQAEDKDHSNTPADDSVMLACPERNVHFPYLTLSLSGDLSGLEVKADSSPNENVLTGEQAEMARGTVHSQVEDPEQVQVEATEVILHSEQGATESVSATKVKEKKRKRAQTGEDDVAVVDGQVETAKDVAVIQHSELQSVELVPEEKMKKKRRTEWVGEEDVPVEASQLESTAQIEAMEVIQHSEKQAAEFVLEKKINKREQVGEDDLAVKTSQLETPALILHPEVQATELVPEKKLKKSKKNRSGVVQENVAVEASQVDNTAQIEATEMVQHSEHQDTESVPEKTFEKKKKREQVVGHVAFQTGQVAATEQAETLEVVQDSQQQSSQSFPEKKLKKKKKNREQVVEENVVVKASQVATTEQVLAMTLDVIQDSEPQATELVSEKKVKKKKKRPSVIEENVAVEASQIETTEQADALELIRDSEQQAPELVPEKKLKKKKKKAGILQENVAVEISRMETTQLPDTLEVIGHSEQQATELALEKKHKKKKKKKHRVVEENMVVDTGLIETTEQVEAVEVIQDSEPQVTELVPEKERKKKKKKKHGVVGENMVVDTGLIETTELVEAVEVIQDSEPQVTELVPGKKRKKKKKKKSGDVEENVAVEATEQVEAVEVIQDSEQPESVPETKLKKRKKKKRQAGPENVNMEQVACLGMVWDCEQKPTEKIPEKKVKKMKDRTSHGSEVAPEGKARKTPWVASENASVSNGPGSLTISNPSISVMETNVSEPDNSSEINEEDGCCSPRPVGSAFLKKKKRRKEKENSALSWVSDIMGHIDQEEFGQRHAGKSSVAQLESSAWPFSDKTGKNKKTSLFSDSESGLSLLQSEDTVQRKTKKKKNKRRAEAAADASAGLYGEDAEYVASQESLRGSQSTPSEAMSEKRKKKKMKRDNIDSGQNVGGIRHMQYVHSLDITTGLERVESPQEVSSTQLGEEDSIPSSGEGIFMSSEKKKQKKKKKKKSKE